MKNILIVIAFWCMTGCSGFEKVDPFITKANFQVEHNDWVAPCEPEFTNLSENAVRFEWDFGDNTPKSIEIAPKHTYYLPGNYDVKLKAFDNLSQYDSIVNRITIKTYLYLRHASSYPYSITVRHEGISYTIPKSQTIIIPTVSVFDLYLWECIGANCNWDGPYQAAPNGHYKVIDSGAQWNLTIVEE